MVALAFVVVVIEVVAGDLVVVTAVDVAATVAALVVVVAAALVVVVVVVVPSEAAADAYPKARLNPNRSPYTAYRRVGIEQRVRDAAVGSNEIGPSVCGLKCESACRANLPGELLIALAAALRSIDRLPQRRDLADHGVSHLIQDVIGAASSSIRTNARLTPGLSKRNGVALAISW